MKLIRLKIKFLHNFKQTYPRLRWGKIELWEFCNALFIISNSADVDEEIKIDKTDGKIGFDCFSVSVLSGQCMWKWLMLSS